MDMGMIHGVIPPTDFPKNNSHEFDNLMLRVKAFILNDEVSGARHVDWPEGLC